MLAAPLPDVAHINGIPLHDSTQPLEPAELRRRACTELLRQAAQRGGLLDAGDSPGADGAITEAATLAIEALIERELAIPEPTEEACRRYFAAHAASFSSAERVRVRHILFAVTPGVDVTALRKRAEATLIDVRSHDRDVDSGFANAARELSNCPSGAAGGELGWLAASDCAPEFAREIFGRTEIGVLPRLVHSRFGLHVVEVLERKPGEAPSFDAVEGAVRAAMRHQAFVTALRQYLRLLAGQSTVGGVDLDGADTPLVR